MGGMKKGASRVLGEDTDDVIPLSELGFQDAFIECLGREICFGVESCVVETGSDFRSIIVKGVSDRKNNHLTRRNPERPEVRTNSQK